MNVRQSITRIAFFFALLLSSTSWAAPSVSELVEKTVRDNLRYTQENDVAKSMNTIHSQSLSYGPTQQFMSQLSLMGYQLSYELLEFRFIAQDGDLAYARVKQRTKKISGPEFSNNELEMLQVFKQEQGVWKIWAQANLSVRMLD